MTTGLHRRTFLGGCAALALGSAGLRAGKAVAAPGAAGWSALLGTYVRPSGDGINRVAYRNWKAGGHGALKRVVAEMEAAKPASMSPAERFSFWVNLYNAKTIDIVLDHYPVRSIRDISLGSGLFGRGPWKKKLVTVAGRELSLDDIEHGILRPEFGDARVHYAVNCASIGCPNLQTKAFEAHALPDMLEAGAKAYINHPRGVYVEGSTVRASKIYDWFAEDFGTQDQLFEHWRRYAAEPLAARLNNKTTRVRYVYDWALNDV